jgi:hypothetical protein
VYVHVQAATLSVYRPHSTPSLAILRLAGLFGDVTPSLAILPSLHFLAPEFGRFDEIVYLVEKVSARPEMPLKITLRTRNRMTTLKIGILGAQFQTGFLERFE